MPPQFLIDPDDIPQETVVDLEGIKAFNPQRFEMEQLTAITLLDEERRLIAGYKDVRGDEFWVRGHLPGKPLLPGVLICESAAQLTSYYSWHFKIAQRGVIVFGGMDQVRFRGMVAPGDRLLLVAHGLKNTARRMEFLTQGFVKRQMVFSGSILGILVNDVAAAADPVA